MITYCTYQIKDAKLSTWQNTVMRNCKLEAEKDGYCRLHHPVNIAHAYESKALEEIVQGLRDMAQTEEKIVGAYMRFKRPDEFAVTLAEVRAAQDFADKLRMDRFR